MPDMDLEDADLDDEDDDDMGENWKHLLNYQTSNTFYNIKPQKWTKLNELRLTILSI